MMTIHFVPKSSITYNELQKIIVSALGYTQYAEMQGGYPDGYLTYSEKLQHNEQH